MNPESSSADAERSSSSSPSPPISTPDFFKAVLAATAIAGTLDIIAAHVHGWIASGKFPMRIFKSIAGGVLGRENAMQGGVGVVLLGGFFHYFISFSFTLLFFYLYPRLGWLRKNIFASAVIYTLLVWSTMNFIVLPLSALHAPMPNFSNKHTFIGVFVLMIVFGLPISFGADRFYKRRCP